MELGKPGLLGCYEKIRCLHGLGCKVGSSCPVCKGGRLSLAARRRRGNSEPGRASVCFSLPADQGIRRRLVSKFLVPQGGQAGTSRATRLLPVKKTPSWWPTVKVSQRNTQHLRRVPGQAEPGRKEGALLPRTAVARRRTWTARGGSSSQAGTALNTTGRPGPASPHAEEAVNF